MSQIIRFSVIRNLFPIFTKSARQEQPGAGVDNVLLENNDARLLENGDTLLLG